MVKLSNKPAPYRGQKAQQSRDLYTESAITPYEGMGHYGAKPWPFDYARAVNQYSGWVYRCVTGNANAAASVPLRMYVRKRSASQLKAMGMGPATYDGRPVPRGRVKYLRGEHHDHRPSAAVRHKLAEFGGDFEEVTDHPALSLLRTVNPMLNGFDLATFRFVSLQLTGNAYMHPVMSQSLMRPSELWPMPPDWTRIIPGKPDGDDMIEGYTFGNGYMREHRFAPDEVLHFAINRGVRDLHYGYGPMEAAWSTVGLSVSKRISDKALFDNMARPDYVLSIEGAGTDEAQRTDARINALHRGVRKVGRALVTTGRARVQTLQFPPKDVGEFAEILEELAGIFGYPIQKLKAAYEPKANAETADYSWMKDTILPMLRHDEETLNQGGYLALFGDGALLDDAVFAYDDPVPANAESERLDTGVYVPQGVWTLNERRAEMGLPPVEGGDEPRINGVAISALDAQARAQAEAASQPFGSIMGPVAPVVPETPVQAPDVAEIVEAMRAEAKGSERAKQPAADTGETTKASDNDTIEAFATFDVHDKAPAKYDDIDFKPTRSMAEAAQQGLDYRDEYGRGGTDVGIARARDIANRRNLSPDTVGRMASFFARHEQNRNPDAEESDGGPSNGWIAWLLWGGDAGKAWAQKVTGQMERADEQAKRTRSSTQTKAINLAKRMRELHKASAVMLTVNGDARDLAEAFGYGIIDPDDLTAEGFEYDPHVTIKWGLKTDHFEDIAAPLRMAQPIRVRFGKTAIFEADEHDVVYVAVESEQLEALHRALGELPNDEPEREYTPHMTLAYVESGKGQQYAGRDDFDGLEAILHTVVFSASNGDASTMTLRSKPTEPDHDQPKGKVVDGECGCKSTDQPEGDADELAEAVKQFGPDAAYMPIGFKGYTTKANADGEATEPAENDIRDGEPETPINRMARLMADAFREQEAAVLSAIKSAKGKRVKVKADETDEQRLAAARNDPRITAMIEALKPDPLIDAASQGLPPMVAAGAQSGSEALGLDVSFDVANPLVEQAARQRSIQLAGDLNQTTINRLRDSLADGIAAGETPAKLTQRVRDQFASFSDARAETIARTESAMAYETGQQAAWQDSGVVEGKEFLVAPGACQFCQAVDKAYKGKSIGLQDVFVPKGETIRGAAGGTMKADYRALDAPPIHPACRCDLIPVLGGEFKQLKEALAKNDRPAIAKFWRRQAEPGSPKHVDNGGVQPGDVGTAGVPG